MRWQGLALVILSYVAMDFGNPMMPGAIQFVAGTLETVDGDRARGDDAPGVAAVPAKSQTVAIEVFRDEGPGGGPRVTASLPRPTYPRKIPRPPADPAPSADDH